MLQLVMRAAADPNIDPQRLEQFLKIGRELEADKAKREWAIAFRSAKDEIDGIRITKRGQIVYPGRNGNADTIIKFTKYEDLADVIKPVLRKHNLTASYTYRSEATPPKTVCILKILHAGGHSENFESVPLPMVDDGGSKNATQGAGSVMTYGRRYSLQAAFDIVAEDEDTDGTLRQQAEPITEEQREQIENIVQACEDKNPGFRRLFTSWLVKELKVNKITELRQGNQLKAVQTKLQEKVRALGI